MAYIAEAVLLFNIIAGKSRLASFQARLEARVFCSFAVILDSSWLHGHTPGAEREAIFRKPFRVDHLLPDDDRNDVKMFVYVMVDLLGIIPFIQDDVREGQMGITIWTAPPKLDKIC